MGVVAIREFERLFGTELLQPEHGVGCKSSRGPKSLQLPRRELIDARHKYFSMITCRASWS